MRDLICALVCLASVGGAATAQDVTIDDFDGYTDTSALRENWYGGVFLESGIVHSPPKAMRPMTGTLAPGYPSSYNRMLGPPMEMQSGSLSFRYYVSDSLTTIPTGDVRFQIQLFDGSTNCTLDPEITPTARDAWNLASLSVPPTCGASDLSVVTLMTLVLRNRSTTAGVLTAYFDDFVISGAVPVELQRFSVD